MPSAVDISLGFGCHSPLQGFGEFEPAAGNFAKPIPRGLQRNETPNLRLSPKGYRLFRGVLYAQAE
jgi:hypothetical protein